MLLPFYFCNYSFSSNGAAETRTEVELKTELSEEEIDNIINKGWVNRPDPAIYLSKDYIETHLAQSEDGGSYVMSRAA